MLYTHKHIKNEFTQTSDLQGTLPLAFIILPIGMPQNSHSVVYKAYQNSPTVLCPLIKNMHYVKRVVILLTKYDEVRVYRVALSLLLYSTDECTLMYFHCQSTEEYDQVQ